MSKNSLDLADNSIMNGNLNFQAEVPKITKKTKKFAKIVKQAKNESKMTGNDSSKNYIIRLIEKKRTQKNQSESVNNSFQLNQSIIQFNAPIRKAVV
jgi:hypothetical protein